MLWVLTTTKDYIRAENKTSIHLLLIRPISYYYHKSLSLAPQLTVKYLTKKPTQCTSAEESVKRKKIMMKSFAVCVQAVADAHQDITSLWQQQNILPYTCHPSSEPWPKVFNTGRCSCVGPCIFYMPQSKRDKVHFAETFLEKKGRILTQTLGSDSYRGWDVSVSLCTPEKSAE